MVQHVGCIIRPTATSQNGIHRAIALSLEDDERERFDCDVEARNAHEAESDGHK
jgi:hypothetical protein